MPAYKDSEFPNPNITAQDSTGRSKVSICNPVAAFIALSLRTIKTLSLRIIVVQ